VTIELSELRAVFSFGCEWLKLSLQFGLEFLLTALTHSRDHNNPLEFSGFTLQARLSPNAIALKIPFPALMSKSMSMFHINVDEQMDRKYLFWTPESLDEIIINAQISDRRGISIGRRRWRRKRGGGIINYEPKWISPMQQMPKHISRSRLPAQRCSIHNLIKLTAISTLGLAERVGCSKTLTC
jgi:hypothetical protein